MQLDRMTPEEIHEADWCAVLAAKPGDILVDRMEGDVRFIIKRGAFSLCAYLGVPASHPLAGLNYDEIQDVFVHGGWTYCGKIHPDGYWFFGWDYAHGGDYTAIAEAHPEVPFLTSPGGHKWTVRDVEIDSEQAILDFRFLAKERE